MNKRTLGLIAAGALLLVAALWWAALRSKQGSSPSPAASRPAPSYIPPQPLPPAQQALPQPDEPPAGIPAGVHTGAFDPQDTRREAKLNYEAHQKQIKEEEEREAADGARERAAWLASRPPSDVNAEPDEEGDVAKMEAREKEKRAALKKSFKANKKRSKLKAQQRDPALPPPLIFGDDQEPPPGMNPKLYTGGKKPDGTQKSPAGK